MNTDSGYERNLIAVFFMKKKEQVNAIKCKSKYIEKRKE